MRTKNSLELFEQAVASYKLSQCLSKPDNELYHAAFYFALHRFFSGEDFPWNVCMKHRRRCCLSSFTCTAKSMLRF